MNDGYARRMAEAVSLESKVSMTASRTSARGDEIRSELLHDPQPQIVFCRRGRGLGRGERGIYSCQRSP